jgi:hypothetical protein
MADFEVIPTTRKQVPGIHRLICKVIGKEISLQTVIQSELALDATSIVAINPMDPSHIRGFITAKVVAGSGKVSSAYRIGCLCTADPIRVDIASALLRCLIDRYTEQLTGPKPTFTLMALMPEDNSTLYVSHGFEDGGPSANGRHLFTLTRTYIPD